MTDHVTPAEAQAMLDHDFKNLCESLGFAPPENLWLHIAEFKDRCDSLLERIYGSDELTAIERVTAALDELDQDGSMAPDAYHVVHMMWRAIADE